MGINLKTCFRTLLATAMLSGGVFGAKAADGVGVIVVRTDGTSYEIELPQLDRITFGTDGVGVENTSGEIREFAYDNVDRIMLSAPLSGIREITSGGEIAVWPHTVTGTLNIAGAQPGTDVRVYSLGGVQVASGRCSDGTLTIDLSGTQSGVYIVAIGKHTVKIIKQ